jgi:hypothetical protein
MAQEPEGQTQAAARDAAEKVEDNPAVFVLTRELAEVHLLLDNISADPDTTIGALSGRERPEGLPEDWIEQICLISWPPPDSDATKAQQAALLIRAKDYLNRLAKPASGASIAFTVLVTQDDDDPDPRAHRRPGVDMEEVQSRASLAKLAFPDYEGKAQRFRQVQKRINLVLLIWLVLTCFTSWYAAFGNSTLGEFASAQKRYTEARAAVNDLEAGRRRPAGTGTAGAAGADPALARQAGQSGTVDVPEIGYCNRWKAVPSPSGIAVRQFQSADQHQACVELKEANAQLVLAGNRLEEWVWMWRWLVGGEKNNPLDAAAVALHLTAVIGTAALPVLYGFLGAGAAVLRSISHRIKASTLSPRDISLSLQQLALGAVVGACIGLFIVQPGAEQALIGPVALSTSAISFIAGFGVEAVFQALEALISRIFNIAPAAASRAAPRDR